MNQICEWINEEFNQTEWMKHSIMSEWMKHKLMHIKLLLWIRLTGKPILFLTETTPPSARTSARATWAPLISRPISMWASPCDKHLRLNYPLRPHWCGKHINQSIFSHNILQSFLRCQLLVSSVLMLLQNSRKNQ